MARQNPWENNVSFSSTIFFRKEKGCGREALASDAINFGSHKSRMATLKMYMNVYADRAGNSALGCREYAIANSSFRS